MAARKKTGGGTKGKIILLFLVLVAAVSAFFVFVSRDKLPGALRDNAVIAKTYKFKDALLSSPGDAAPVDPEKKQLGYPKDDRKKLDSLITTETKPETEQK